MLQQLTLPGFGVAISSPELPDGQKPCALPDGLMPSPSGPDRHPASPSAPQGNAVVATTPATSAPDLSIWCGPDAPLCCSANRSRARTLSDALQGRANAALERNLRGRGGMIYRFAWKRQDTPHGRQLFLLRPSAHPTSANACSSPPSIFDLPMGPWPTATTRDWKDGGNPDVNVPLNGLLGRVVWLAGWTTPCAQEPGGTMERYLERKGRKPGGAVQLAHQVEFAGWPTAAASDGTGGKGPRSGVSMTGRMPDGSKVTMDLSASVKLAMDHPGPARLTASGDLLTGSCAGMRDGGQLNPEHSRWLMGYPAAWGSCGATAMRSCRRQPRSSSTPAAKS